MRESEQISAFPRLFGAHFCTRGKPHCGKRLNCLVRMPHALSLSYPSSSTINKIIISACGGMMLISSKGVFYYLSLPLVQETDLPSLDSVRWSSVSESEREVQPVTPPDTVDATTPLRIAGALSFSLSALRLRVRVLPHYGAAVNENAAAQQ